MFKRFNITCEEATTICDKSQYGEATIKEKFKLIWHISTCKFCSLYSRQNSLLTSLYKGKAKQCTGMNHCLKDEDKDALKERMKELTL